VWIAECISQNQKDRIGSYIPVMWFPSLSMFALFPSPLVFVLVVYCCLT
jgi:hypothetical protein